jgi:hypothetical protein
MVDEVGRSVGHAPSATRRAEGPPLATKSQETIVAARVAVQSKKAVGQDPAVQVGAYFALNESSDWHALPTRLGEEGLDVLSYNLVEQRLFRMVTLVLDGAGSRRDRGLCAPRKGKFRARPTASESDTLRRCWGHPHAALRRMAQPR